MAGPGQVLGEVIVNTAAASAVVTLYDATATQGTSGQKIAAIDASSKNSSTYNVTLTNGLYVVIAGGAPDVTITVGTQW